MTKKSKIFLSGGGTMGSVMPLFALIDDLKNKYQVFWIGSFRGPEKLFLLNNKVNYFSIPSGKLRKYFSLKNLFAPIFIFSGFIASFLILLFNSPKILIVSGSFVSVPVVWSAWLLKIPIIVHQEDIKIGLAGKLSIKFAKVVTTSFKETLDLVKNENKVWLGNPIRKNFLNIENEDIKKWKIDSLPLIVVLGGGLGAEDINKAIADLVPEICNSTKIIHITGVGKEKDIKNKNYKQFDFLDKEFYSLLASADIVISRAGLSTITELSCLSKPSILIPLNGVGQLENAKYLEKNNACILLESQNLEKLKDIIKNILKDKEKQKILSRNINKIFPPNANLEMIKIIDKNIKK